MSSYGREMERQFSQQSISSRENSETGSHYTMETGIYMSSFAATIFLAGLVTVGVSVMTLLIALTVMLQSCQSRSSGVVQKWQAADYYDHCRIFSLHAELNSLKPDYFPETCRDFAIQYMREGRYLKDLNTTAELVVDYLSNLNPEDDSRDVVLMDVDDFIPSDCLFPETRTKQFNQHDINYSTEDAKYLKRVFFLELYHQIRGRRWPIILFSRKPEEQREGMVQYLNFAGYDGWTLLITRTEHEMPLDKEYFSQQRTMLQDEGFHIKAVISSQMDALTSPNPGERLFKLPNPISLDNLEHTLKAQTS